MKKITLGLLCASSLLTFSRLSLLAVLGFLVAIALMVRLPQGGVVRKVLWVYMGVFCAVCVLFELAWLVGITVAPTAALVLLSAASWLCFALIRGERKQDKRSATKMHWAGIAAALAICIFVNLPVLMAPSAISVLRFAAKTGDDGNHLHLMEANRRIGGHIYTYSVHSAQLIDQSFVGYPQGWHANGAVLEAHFLKLIGKDNAAYRLLSYLLYKTLWLFIAVYMVYELMVAVAVGYLRKFSVALSAALGYGGFVLSASMLVAAYGYGFQNFIAATALVCAALVVACNLVTKTKGGGLHIVALSLLTVGATTVWVLPGVLIGLLTVVLLLKQHVQHRAAWWQWGAVVVAGALSLLQVFITQRAAPEGASSLNLGGAVPPISVWGVLVLLVLCAGLVMYSKARIKTWLLFFIGLSSFEFILLAAYQQVAFGEARYYALKLAMMAAIIVGAILLAVLVGVLHTWHAHRYAKALVYIGIVLALPFCLGLDPRKSAYPLKDSAPIQEVTARQILASGNNPNAVIYGTNPEETFLATKLVSDVEAYNSAERQRVLKYLNDYIQ